MKNRPTKGRKPLGDGGHVISPRGGEQILNLISSSQFPGVVSVLASGGGLEVGLREEGEEGDPAVGLLGYYRTYKEEEGDDVGGFHGVWVSEDGGWGRV